MTDDLDIVDLDGGGMGCGFEVGHDAVIGVEGEIPHYRQTFRVPGGGALRSQHRDLLVLLVVAVGY